MNHQHCDNTSGCSTEQHCGNSYHHEEECCPVTKATQMWESAFFTALHQVHVDVLKAKMQKAWAGKMDKAADAVLKAMESHWHAKLQCAATDKELKDKLAKIMMESVK